MNIDDIAKMITEDPSVMNEMPRDFKRRYESMPAEKRYDSSQFYFDFNKHPAFKVLTAGMDSGHVIDMINKMCERGKLQCEFQNGANRPIYNRENVNTVKGELIAAALRGLDGPPSLSMS